MLSVSNPDTRVDDAEFAENEVYSIDIVSSTGEGKVIVLFLRKCKLSFYFLFGGVLLSVTICSLSS